MTIAAPEAKDKEVVTEEPTLSTQVEANNDAVTGEELVSEDKPMGKKKSIFNHRFGNKGTKKDAATNTEEVVATDVENKKSKGFGNFLSRVKQNGNTTRELAEPVVLLEDENVVEHEDVHENVKPTETPTTGDHAKRQSLLSKLFGNTKKEPMTESTDQVVTTATNDQQTEEVTPSSPPLSRRVTGFFSKKKSEKKQQGKATTEKVETDELSAKEAPTVVVTNDDDATTVDESTTLPIITTTTTTTQGITA